MILGRILTIAALSLCVAQVVAPPSSHALKLDPGQWEFTTTSKNPMTPAPRVETKTECVVDGNRSADEFLAGMKECQVSDIVDSDTTMSYKISCPRGPVSLTGSADMKADGKTIAGEMQMSMDMGGQAMLMNMAWAGKRLGPCKTE